MAGFFQRLWARLFSRKKVVARPGMNIPAPATLVAKVAHAEDQEERLMIKTAEEALARGFPEQAAKVYEKAAQRFGKQGKALKRIAMLQQRARVLPHEPVVHLDLVAAYESIDRKRDADLARLRAAEVLRERGDTARAAQLDAQVVPPALSRARSSVMGARPPMREESHEMPGDAVPLAALELHQRAELPPVHPTELGGPDHEPFELDPDQVLERAPARPEPVDQSGAILLDLELPEPIVEPVRHAPQVLRHGSLESGAPSPRPKSMRAPPAPVAARAPSIAEDVGLSADDLEMDDDPSFEPDEDEITGDNEAATVAMMAIDFEKEMALRNEAEARDNDAATVAMMAVDFVPAPDTAPTPAAPPRPRFNIADAATQMDPRGVPGAVVGTEHERTARAESRVSKIEDSSTRAYGPDVLAELARKLGK